MDMYRFIGAYSRSSQFKQSGTFRTFPTVQITLGTCAKIGRASVSSLFRWRHLIKKVTGTTFVAVTAEAVKNLVLPLPPLEEQRRIVAKIEEMLQLTNRMKNTLNPK